MTNQQWRDELAACLEGTDWVVDWAGVIKDFPNCLAEAHHRVTLRARQIDVLQNRFRTPTTRKAEIRRQLSG